MPRLLKLLEDPLIGNEEKWKAVLEAIGKIGDKTAVKPLVDQLRSPQSWDWDATWGRRIIKALGEIGDPDAFEVLQEMLKKLHTRYTDELLEAMGKIDDPRALPLLVEAFRQEWNMLKVRLPTVEIAAMALLRRGWQPAHDTETVWFGIALRDWNRVESLGKTAVWPLVEALNSLDSVSRRSEVAGCLQNIGGLEILVENVTSYSCFEGERREAVARALELMGDQRAIPALLILLNDHAEAVRTRAAEALCQIGDKRVVEPLRAVLAERGTAVSQLDHRSGLLGFEAAIALARLGDQTGMPMIVRALQGQDYLLTAMFALSRIGTTEAKEHLAGLLQHSDSGVQKEAAALLKSMDWQPKDDIQRLLFAIAKQDWEDAGRLAGTGVNQPLVERLLDENDTIREGAIEALETSGWQPKDDAERALWAVARTAWAEVVAIGAPAVDYLLQVLQEWDTVWLSDAVEVLGEIGDARATEPLIVIVRDKDQELSEDARDDVRSQSIVALGKIGDSRAIPPLADILGDTGEKDDRADAARALGDIAGDAAIKALNAVVVEDDEDLKLAVEEALEQCRDSEQD